MVICKRNKADTSLDHMFVFFLSSDMKPWNLLSQYFLLGSTLNVTRVYTVDPIHRGPLFREIQCIASRPWTPELP